MADEPERRGVQNPRVVDLIARDAERDEVELLMLEERSWDGGSEQLRQIEGKFNSYLAYVQSGQLARDYPQYAGKPVRFRLECAEAPAGQAERMLSAMRDFAAGEGIAFVVSLASGGGASA